MPWCMRACMNVGRECACMHVYCVQAHLARQEKMRADVRRQLQQQLATDKQACTQGSDEKENTSLSMGRSGTGNQAGVGALQQRRDQYAEALDAQLAEQRQTKEREKAEKQAEGVGMLQLGAGEEVGVCAMVYACIYECGA